MPGTVLICGDLLINKEDMNPTLKKLMVSHRRREFNQILTQLYKYKLLGSCVREIKTGQTNNCVNSP